LNVQWQFSQLLLLGLERIEARKYALGNRGINVGEEMWLVETRGDAGSDAKQLAQAEMSDEMIGPRPDKSHIIGTIMFLTLGHIAIGLVPLEMWRRIA